MSDGLAIAKVSYTHDAMIDLLIANPIVKQGELARHFGYTEPWVSQIMSSDAFKARLAARKAELSDPLIIRSVEENLEGLAQEGMRQLRQKLETMPQTPETLLKTIEISTRALGYGARGPQVQINQQYVALIPEKVADVEQWGKTYAPQPAESGG